MSENRVNSEINDLNVESFDDSEDMKLIEISLSANAWITKSCADFQEFDADFDSRKWISDETIVSVYFFAKNSVKFNLFMKCKVSDGKSVLKLTIGHKTSLVEIEGNTYQWLSVGKFRVIGSGYTEIDLQGIEKSGPYFAEISDFMFVYNSVESEENPFKLIPDIDKNHTYWSRRGPSVYLSYDFEKSESDEYYYNEVSVPQRYDPIGSYFMAIGFNNGYFGIQVCVCPLPDLHPITH